MEPKRLLLFLFLLVVVSGLYGMKRSANPLLINQFIDDNDLTGTALDHVSDGVLPMDTIYGIAFATRVDSLYKYLEKAPNDSWKIVFKDGIMKPDLQMGDILRVTSENGTVKDYFLKLEKYIPGTSAKLSSITWPDMPAPFKGELAAAYGWKGDTIPSFDPLTKNYVLILPLAYQRIPALTFSTQHPNSTVAVTRAKSLEGSVAERTITFSVTAEDSITKNIYSVLLEIEQDTLDIEQKSTVTSKFYKVSKGYSLNETIQGLMQITTVAFFYEHLTKASELQTLKVISAASGAERSETDLISIGDILMVISADNTRTSKYILEGTFEVPNANTLLCSSIYTISVTGSTGTISGFDQNTLLKTVLAGIVIPGGATLTMVDQYDAYKTLQILNYDSMYVNVRATSAVYFEVIADNGLPKVLYQLMPTSNSSDAYVTSDLYNIDQYTSAITFVLNGGSVSSFLSKLTPAPGATMLVLDKGGFVRSSGILYRDDRLMVTSEDGTTTKAYYFIMPSGYGGGPYVAFVVSDDYTINQISHMIYGPSIGLSISEFKSKLYPAYGSILKVIDVNGNESTLGTLALGDRLQVTSADGTQTATYSIAGITGVDPVYLGSTVSMFPNPTTGKVIVQGLVKGNRLRVMNAAGIVLHDVIADRLTETISLEAQPAGIYLVVVTAGTQNIHIQKLIKK